MGDRVVDLACAGIWAPDFHILLSEVFDALLCVVLFIFVIMRIKVDYAISHTWPFIWCICV